MGLPISVEEVSKSYDTGGGDQLHVLDEISTEIADNEFIGIVGPSGCGKTTLLKMMDGLVTPSQGTIHVGGKKLEGPISEVGMVFQDFQLFPWRTTVRNVELGLEIEGIDKTERRNIATEWIETVGLSGFEDSYPSELSGGMQQRVGLARALAIDPEVLLMDEPFGALDAQTKERLQVELLKLLDDEDKTIVFITHDISEAIFLADRVLVMSTKPATIIRDLEIEFERPRWNNRSEIEGTKRYAKLQRTIREDLGLTSEAVTN